MSLLFAIPALLALGSAIWVVRAKVPVHQVLALIANFISLSVLFLTLSAEFMAFIQIIIYAGAIMVLFIFVIALLTTRKDPVERALSRLKGQGVLGLATGLLIGLGLLVAALRAALPAPAGVPADFGSVSRFGQELLTTHVLSFEVTALILMTAVVGVIILVGRRQA